MSPRFIPLDFPCGCRVRHTWVDGDSCVTTSLCDHHLAFHQEMYAVKETSCGESVHLQDSPIEGCGCPCCSIMEEQPASEPNAWQFLTMEVARRKRRAGA